MNKSPLSIIECKKCSAPIDVPQEALSQGRLKQGQILRCGYCGTTHTYNDPLNVIDPQGTPRQGGGVFFAQVSGGGTVAQGDGSVAISGDATHARNTTIRGHRFWNDSYGMPHHVWHSRGESHHVWLSRYGFRRMHIITDRHGTMYVE